MRALIDQEDAIRILRERSRMLVDAAREGKMRMDNGTGMALASCVLLLAVLEEDIKDLETVE